jgi:hypothetical protein
VVNTRALDEISFLVGHYQVGGVDLPLVKPRPRTDADRQMWDMDAFDRAIIGAGIARFIRQAVPSDFPLYMLQMCDYVLVEKEGAAVARSALHPTRRLIT